MAVVKHSGDAASKTSPKSAFQSQSMPEMTQHREPDGASLIDFARAHFLSARALVQLVRDSLELDEDDGRPSLEHHAISLEVAEWHIRQVVDEKGSRVENVDVFDGQESRALSIITLTNSWLWDIGWGNIPDVSRLKALLESLGMVLGRCAEYAASTSQEGGAA